MNIVCNEHVRCELEIHGTYNDLYQFLPDEGYALWRDNETGNIDPETGEPWCYWLAIGATDTEIESFAPHIWAKLIDETMEVFGDAEPEQPVMKARRMALVAKEPSSTYIDENGVERDKKGVY